MHKLHIISLHDAQAECICGRYYQCYTGALTKEEIRQEFDKHLKHERNYRRRQNRRSKNEN